MTKVDTLNNPSIDFSADSFLTAEKAPEIDQRDITRLSILLRNKPELPGFIEAWRKQPKRLADQVVEEVASYCAETLRTPDPYRFLLTPSGELFSPKAKCRIKDAVMTNTHIGRLEFEALEKIEQFTAANERGAIVWVSPLDPVEYPDNSKIVVSEIEEKDGVKTLYNRAIILDIDQAKCFELALNLAKCSVNKPSLSTVDEVRSNPLILNPENMYWTHILEEFVADLSLKDVRNGKDKAIKEKLLQQAVEIYKEFIMENNDVTAEVVAREMGKREMVGSGETSCPNRTAFGVFADSSVEVGECNKIKCGREGCGWEADENDARQIQEGKLTCCPKCGWKP